MTLHDDRRGSVSVVVGFLMVGLIGMTALAIDVSSAVAAHARLRQAADTGALAAVRQAAIDTAADANASLDFAKAAGAQRFMAQASSIPRVNPAVPVVTVERTGLVITATVTFSNQYATQIAAALSGMSSSFGDLATIPLGGVAAARQTVGAYTDIQVLMDVSNSMAIATAKDASVLKQAIDQNPIYIDGRAQGVNGQYWWERWDQNCQFACHVVFRPNAWVAPSDNINGTSPGSGMYDRTTYDYYALARYYGVTLRIDLIKNAVGQVVQSMQTSPEAARLQFGLDTFDDAERTIVQLGSASNVTTQVTGTEVTAYRNWNTQSSQTAVADSIRAFTRNVSPAGQGLSLDTARKVVIIITDGIEDSTAPNGQRATTTFDPASCDLLKRPVKDGGKGATVFVLQAASKDDFISDANTTGSFEASVSQMSACASLPSDGHYFIASDKAGIDAATAKIIAAALSQPTVLTQPESQVIPPSNTAGVPRNTAATDD